MTSSPALDYYLVLAGQKATSSDARTLRPWLISSVHLFDASRLLTEQSARNVKVGVASSVTERQWAAAEIYPNATSRLISLTQGQRDRLALFSG